MCEFCLTAGCTSAQFPFRKVNRCFPCLTGKLKMCCVQGIYLSQALRELSGFYSNNSVNFSNREEIIYK